MTTVARSPSKAGSPNHKGALGSALLLAGAVAMSIAACTGNIGDPNDGTPDDGGCVGCTPEGIQVAQSTRFPRISHRQWENTVVDLFELSGPTNLSETFADDPLGGKAFDNNSASLEVTPNLWADYQEAAEDVAEMVTTDPGLLAKIIPADLPAEMPDRARAWVEEFGLRAWRRPLTPSEIASVAALFDQAGAHYPEMDPFVGGVRLALELFLQSPHFVYRVELSDQVEGNDLVPLSEWELASRLSYTLWDTMPDPELFRAAEAGELTTDAGLETQIERMLGSDRAKSTIRSFFAQLNQSDQYVNLTKSTTTYPDFDAAVGEDMRQELLKFVEHVAFEEGGGLRELLTSRVTFVTPRLAEIYGIDPSTLEFDESGFAQVELDGAQRSGILTRAGFLAWKGTESQPDTILRGVFVNRRFICSELGEPPDEAMGAELGDEQTNRERVDALTGPGTCGATCHGAKINPIGFAFEHYGALGEWRDLDNGQQIDASATFPFEEGEATYANAVELSNVLADSSQAHACFARFWLEFTLGRDLVPQDSSLVDFLEEESHAGGSVRDVLTALLTSPAFRYRLTTKETDQ